MKDVKAMILAAGLGTRLRPLTDTKPKALLEFRGKTMLEHVINKLKAAGITRVIINVHHFASLIMEFLESNNNFGIHVDISDESGRLMDTGGGIVKARHFFGDGNSFIVHNVDIYSTVSLEALYAYHKEQGNLATLAVKNRPTSRNLLINEVRLLCGWRNNATGQTIYAREEPSLEEMAFSGIQVLDPLIFNYLPGDRPFSLTKAYLELAREHDIHVFPHDTDEWIDMAHPDHFSDLLK